MVVISRLLGRLRMRRLLWGEARPRLLRGEAWAWEGWFALVELRAGAGPYATMVLFLAFSHLFERSRSDHMRPWSWSRCFLMISNDRGSGHPQPWPNWRLFSLPRPNKPRITLSRGPKLAAFFIPSTDGALPPQTRDDCTMIATHAISHMYASTLPSTLAMGHATAGRLMGNGALVSAQATRPPDRTGIPERGLPRTRGDRSFPGGSCSFLRFPFVPFILFSVCVGRKQKKGGVETRLCGTIRTDMHKGTD